MELDPNHTFVLGNEPSNDRLWLGKLQLVAVYNLALTQGQIEQNTMRASASG